MSIHEQLFNQSISRNLSIQWFHTEQMVKDNRYHPLQKGRQNRSGELQTDKLHKSSIHVNCLQESIVQRRN